MPTNPKPKRVTITRIEAAKIIDSLRDNTNVATTPIETVTIQVFADTGITVTNGIIKSLLKEMGIPHVSFRSTPRPKSELERRVDELELRIEGLNSRLDFTTNVLTDLVGKMKILGDSNNNFQPAEEQPSLFGCGNDECRDGQ